MDLLGSSKPLLVRSQVFLKVKNKNNICCNVSEFLLRYCSDWKSEGSNRLLCTAEPVGPGDRAGQETQRQGDRQAASQVRLPLTREEEDLASHRTVSFNSMYSVIFLYNFNVHQSVSAWLHYLLTALPA